jgi:hypothetical protein
MIIWDKNQAPAPEAEAPEEAVAIVPEDAEMEAIIDEAQAAKEIMEEIEAARPLLRKGFGLGK